MRRSTLLLVTMGLLVPLAAKAGTSVSLGVTIGDAPPPPVVVVREEPRVVVVPGSTVYVVNDRRIGYDSFRYGVYWYVYNDGFWYRSRSWRGPFRSCEGRYVPRAILSVPARHWKHHPHGGPPGLAKRHRGHGRGNDVVVVDRGHDVVVVKEKKRGRR